jgi:hypothetical protein
MGNRVSMLEQEVALLDAAGEVIFVPGPSVLFC